MKPPLPKSQAKPSIAVLLTRDSVCAGDDGDAPHEKRVEVPALRDPEAFANATSAGYLASVAGVGHSWTCLLNDVKIAEIRVSGTRPLVPALEFAAENRVHFVYHSARF